jgi:ABC-type bacteriocin/lantibiotic exporter with double-glycine peptidase domain
MCCRRRRRRRRRFVDDCIIALRPLLPQIVSIVGGSGTGKSTIGALLTRMYDPQSGSIKIDGACLQCWCTW